jgi:hypothetical protein
MIMNDEFKRMWKKWSSLIFYTITAFAFRILGKPLKSTVREGSLRPMIKTADPICERCLEDDESSIHILCDCEAVAYTRFRHLGQYLMEPSDYFDALIDKVLHFIRSVGLIKG